MNNTEISDDDFLFKWIIKAMKQLMIRISSSCKSVEKLEIIFLHTHRADKNEEYAEEIKMFLEAIGNSESLRDSMKYLTFEANATEVMVGLISSFYNLEVLKIIDCSYLEGEYFPLIKTQKLKWLNLSGSHQINYDCIYRLVKNNSSTLRELKIDGENMESDQFSTLIDTMEVIEDLFIYFASSAKSDLLMLLSNHRNTIQKLVIRKNEYFESKELCEFFGEKFPKLTHLKLDDW